jgi:predicted pyridoxine 5'-phosphate oxidase superfamily flavin-nucleotide-binding protein
MPHGFADIAFTDTVKRLQTDMGSRTAYARMSEAPEALNTRLSDAEAAFITGRDSFYMATVGETGWPYVQHRGGPAGFVRVMDDSTLGFADFRGNRQYVSIGNLQTNNRVSLFFMDYAGRSRLKLFGRARIIGPNDAALLARLEMPDYRARVERGIVISVEGFDWNCPQHITPRVSTDQVTAATEILSRRIAELEARPRPPGQAPDDPHR